jgi:hypothetical protein
VVSEGAEQDVQGEAPDERDGTLPIQTQLEGEGTLPLQTVLDMLVHAGRYVDFDLDMARLLLDTGDNVMLLELGHVLKATVRTCARKPNPIAPQTPPQQKNP